VKNNLRRWLGWLALATAFAVACVFLSNWQFNRRAEAVAKLDLVNSNFDQAPVQLDQILVSGKFKTTDEWRPVALHGKYLADQAVLVRNRPYNGSPGFLQLIPFLITSGANSGEIVAIETGWLPTGDKQDSPDQVPLPEGNEIDLVARVRAVEPTLNRSAPAGQIATLNVTSLINKTRVSELGSVHQDFYARASNRFNDGELPIPLPRPQLTEGNHLSYALQWILFALMAFGVLFWAIRQERQQRRMQSEPGYKPKQRKRIGDEDKNFEDSVVG